MSEPEAPLDVAAIRAQDAARTQGEWGSSHEPRHVRARVWANNGGVDICEMLSTLSDEEYIANAPRNIRALLAENERLSADVTLQGDALLRWREMTGSGTPYAARETLEHERKVSAAWKALAKAERARCFSRSAQEQTNARRAIDAARADLRALGIDPEAP